MLLPLGPAALAALSDDLQGVSHKEVMELLLLTQVSNLEQRGRSWGGSLTIWHQLSCAGVTPAVLAAPPSC